MIFRRLCHLLAGILALAAPCHAKEVWGPVFLNPSPGPAKVQLPHGDGFSISYDEILRSQDGLKWRRMQIPTGVAFPFLLAPFKTGFVTIGWANDPFIAPPTLISSVSLDRGKTWSVGTPQPAKLFGGLPGQAVSFGDNIYAMIWGSRVISSSDGKTWTARLSIDASGIASNGQCLVATDRNGVIYQSTDGVYWRSRPLSHPSLSLGGGGGSFVLLAGVFNSNPEDKRQPRQLYLSNNGFDWKIVLRDESGDMDRVLYSNGLWIVPGTNVVRTSPDGIHWTKTPSPPTNAEAAMTFGNKLYLYDQGGNFAFRKFNDLRPPVISKIHATYSLGSPRYAYIEGYVADNSYVKGMKMRIREYGTTVWSGWSKVNIDHAWSIPVRLRTSNTYKVQFLATDIAGNTSLASTTVKWHGDE